MWLAKHAAFRASISALQYHSGPGPGSASFNQSEPQLLLLWAMFSTKTLETRLWSLGTLEAWLIVNTIILNVVKGKHAIPFLFLMQLGLGHEESLPRNCLHS